ncbi:helix-turn-helix domain-containing protein [Prevotella intermedia]|nr:AraC family transcriptional regulator [Prevotella intermedia]
MSEEYYTRESRQILGALIETDGELTFLEILQRTGINMMIAVSVCSQLLRVEEITYRMINGVQYFRINEHFLQPQHPTDTCHLREEDIYLLFHQLLKQHIQEHFTVRDYASLLTLTPKQLTRIVLCASGKSAREWIEESTIREIRNMLEHTQFTIKEISNKLNFPNTAFFSRFFKRKTGYSPSEYRRYISGSKYALDK